MNHQEKLELNLFLILINYMNNFKNNWNLKKRNKNQLFLWDLHFMKVKKRPKEIIWMRNQFKKKIRYKKLRKQLQRNQKSNQDQQINLMPMLIIYLQWNRISLLLINKMKRNKNREKIKNSYLDLEFINLGQFKIIIKFNVKDNNKNR